MRLTAIFIMLFVIQMGILIFDNTYTITDTSNPYDNSSWSGTMYEANGTTTSSNSSVFWTSMLNPSSFTGTSLITQLLSSLVAVTATSAIVLIGLGLLGAKSDLVLKVPLAILFLGVGVTPIWQLYGVITREPALFGCAAGVVCATATIAAFFISGMLFLLLVLGVISWWTGVDTG
jgi:hypothetical protein